MTASEQLYLVLIDPVLNLEPVVHMHKSDLPNHETVDQEIRLWKRLLAEYSREKYTFTHKKYSESRFVMLFFC